MAGPEPLPTRHHSFTVGVPRRHSEHIRIPGFSAFESLETDLITALDKNGTARINAPDGDREIFGQKHLRVTLEGLKRHKPEARVKAVTAPVIMGDEKGVNPLVDLARDGLLELYTRRTRTSRGSFILIDFAGGFKALIADFHSPLASFSERRFENLDSDNMSLQEAYDRCRGLADDFDRWISGKGETPAAAQEPLVVPEPKFRELISRISEARRPYDHMGREEIEGFLEAGVQVPV